MNNLIETPGMNLAALRREDLINCNGGEVPIIPAGALSPYLAVYTSLAALAYYAGYGARIVYDAVKQ